MFSYAAQPAFVEELRSEKASAFAPAEICRLCSALAGGGGPAARAPTGAGARGLYESRSWTEQILAESSMTALATQPRRAGALGAQLALALALGGALAAAQLTRERPSPRRRLASGCRALQLPP